MTYFALKHLHVTCVVLSGLGFFGRGLLMLSGAGAYNWRLTRVLPHLIDSLLLVSAISLAVWSGQYPLAQAWLTAKVMGLLAYIVLGSLALRRGGTRSRRARLMFWLAALAVFAYIVSVALTRQPAGVFRLLLGT